MTRAEILDCLTDRPCDYCKFHESGRCERWNCVFEEKLDECEDAISRQATVERLCKVAEFMNEKRNGLGSPYVMAALFIQDNKDEFPSVTPKQKMGRWIKHIQWEISMYECSECSTWTDDDSGFCPNCGVKMAESEDKE